MRCDLRTVIWNKVTWQSKRLVSNIVPLNAGHSTRRGDIQGSKPFIWKESIFVEYGAGMLPSRVVFVTLRNFVRVSVDGKPPDSALSRFPLATGHKLDQIRSDCSQRRKGAERKARSAWRSGLCTVSTPSARCVVTSCVRDFRKDTFASTKHQSCILHHVCRSPSAQPWRESCATVQRRVKCRMMVRP